MTGFDLIIFDCDGVIVDSEIIAAQQEAKLLTDAGYPIEAMDLAERFSGMNWKNILLEVEKEANIPLQASLLDKSEKLLDARLAKSVKGIEGVRQAAIRVNLPRCICSNSMPERITAMLKRTGYLELFAPHIFSAAVIGEKRPKPAPDVFVHAAREMRVDARRTVVLEDSVHGIGGARAAGMRVIGFTGASHTYPSHADRLTEAGAETVINRMTDLPATVEALSSWSEFI
ncbi:MAG: HAD family hydrolase [Hyphomicrobiales bacterium]|nr:HAD family hydrolase [Hyphomicrobiales bacterium]MCP5001819.1 HAD family hydrolase [Hyphomicrobiales bacterium]